MFYVYLYEKHYEIKDIMVTQYYTFEQLFSDFLLFLETNDIPQTDLAKLETWVFKINRELFTASDLRSLNVRDIVTNEDRCVFEKMTFETESRLRDQMSIFKTIRNFPFNRSFVASLNSTIERIRSSDNRVSDLLGDALRLANESRRQRGGSVFESPQSDEAMMFASFLSRVLVTASHMPTETMFFDLGVQLPEQTDVIVSLKESFFDSLPVRECSENELCIICQENIEPGTIIKQIKCGHEFHIECIRPWLTLESVSCPTCRTELCDNDSQKEYHNT